jgi:hypothetical protein
MPGSRFARVLMALVAILVILSLVITAVQFPV